MITKPITDVDSSPIRAVQKQMTDLAPMPPGPFATTCCTSMVLERKMDVKSKPWYVTTVTTIILIKNWSIVQRRVTGGYS